MFKHMQKLVIKPTAIHTRIAVAMATLCILLVLSLTPATSYADGANNRKDAISQALSRSGDGAKVLGVKRIKRNNGSVVFAVKVISNGRVKTIRIPKNSQ